ncbi:MAG: TraR/DksA C4-type zinc finger protein, partial [Pseudomonadota bacterium]
EEARRTLRYVEPLNDARTPLADFFSILLDGRAKAEIEAIDLALFKLRTAQYGRCEQCEKAIPQSRLEVVPAAPMCMACEQAGENQSALRK